MEGVDGLAGRGVSIHQTKKKQKMEIRKTENNNDKQRLMALVRKPVFRICKHQRGRPACAKSAQSDQHLYYSLIRTCY